MTNLSSLRCTQRLISINTGKRFRRMSANGGHSVQYRKKNQHFKMRENLIIEKDSLEQVEWTAARNQNTRKRFLAADSSPTPKRAQTKKSLTQESLSSEESNPSPLIYNRLPSPFHTTSILLSDVDEPDSTLSISGIVPLDCPVIINDVEGLQLGPHLDKSLGGS
ncbi:hypothetical protein BC937DRAFT_90458 [Endogone sp. FLAS-F59071]|nr:hypothetical protein BC937DRAFT_90458 [Endogone sp. FLAS-F59071]|eukprot:RUS17079.1 hypothetical protein BC937DRAFT_90458 [Endogone sp. FLAS-F59071]